MRFTTHERRLWFAEIRVSSAAHLSIYLSTVYAKSGGQKVLKTCAFLLISAQKVRKSVNFLQVSARFYPHFSLKNA
jgi:hypothetical protein